MNSVSRYEPYGWYNARRHPAVQSVIYCYKVVDRVQIDCRREEAVNPNTACVTFPRRLKWLVETPGSVTRLVMCRPPEKFRG